MSSARQQVVLHSERKRTITVHAPAKVNLTLRVLGRRPDGYHLLDSLIVPVGLFDRLRISVTPATRCSVALTGSGGSPAGAENLAARAARLFLDRTAEKAEVRLHLQKEIPVGAGLGGGSSDAAAVLLGLDHLSGVKVGRSELMKWAIGLGTDVPFFVGGRPARVRGVGEVVEALEDYPGWPLVVAFPGRELSTARVYQRYDRTLTNAVPAGSNFLFTNNWKDPEELLINELETAACEILPDVRLLKRRLVDLGARAAMMTGSGSAVFGVWDRSAEADSAAERLRAGGIWARVAEILGQAPIIHNE